MTPLGQFLDPALVHRLNQWELSARSVVDGSAGGLRRSPRRGASVEFAQHRPFAPGDAPRRIDWRVLARTGRLFVREDQEETNTRVLLALDASGSMNYWRAGDSKFRYAQRLIAALAYLLLWRREAVGLAMFSEQIDAWLPIANVGTQLSSILDLLQHGGTSRSGSSHHALAMLPPRLSRRSLVVVASDLFTPINRLNDALGRLRQAHHEVILLRVLHPDERAFPFDAPVRFSGLEGERPVVGNAALVRSLYLKRFSRHAHDLDRLCAKHGVELHDFATDLPLDEAVISFLTMRHRR